MQLGTKGRYAVIAMLRMSDTLKHQHIVPLSQIAEAENISITYLEQLFTRLRKSGLVVSSRGSMGGYTLGRSASAISLAEIIMAADENLFFTRCDPVSSKGCTKTGALCKTHHLWEGLTNQVFNFLGNITLEDLTVGNIPQGSDSQWLMRKQVVND